MGSNYWMRVDREMPEGHPGWNNPAIDTTWHNANAPRQNVPIYMIADFLTQLGWLSPAARIINEGGVLDREMLVWLTVKDALNVLPVPVQRVFTVARDTGHQVLIDAPIPGNRASDYASVTL